MKKNHKLILLLILFIALFLRLFKLNQLFYFSMDEALIAFRALGLFKYKRLFLIGGISPLQIHLPPYFYYLASIFLAVFNFNPAGWGIWGALIGILTIIGLYFFTKKIINKNTAVVASILYTASFTAVFFDRHFWPLSFNPLFTILTLFLLTKLNKKSIKHYFLLFFCLAFIITADPSNIPLILTSLFFLIKNLKKVKLKFVGISSLIAGLVFLTPLLLFDFRHNWQNFKGINKLFNSASINQFSLQKFIDSLLLVPRTMARFFYSPQTDIIQLHSYCIPFASARQHNLPIILVAVSIAILIWFLFSAKKPIEKTISYLILFYIFGITLFGTLSFSIFDHYLTGLLPIFAFITAKLLTKLPKLLTVILLTTFITLNLYQISQAKNPYGLKHKQELINWANKELKGQNFSLDSISKCHKENGLRYLFELIDNSPKQSFMDPNFSWLYNKASSRTLPDKVLLVTDKPLTVELPVISQQNFGAMNAYIIDNSGKAYKINF